MKSDPDALLLASNWSSDKLQALKNTIANASDNAIARLDNIDILNAWGRMYSGGFQVAVLSKIDELFDAAGVPRVALKEGSPVNGEVELNFNWNGEDITETFKVINDGSGGGLKFKFKFYKEKGSPGNANSTITHRWWLKRGLSNIKVPLLERV